MLTSPVHPSCATDTPLHRPAPTPGTLALHVATIDRPTPATIDALGDALGRFGGCVHVDGDSGTVWGEPADAHDGGWHVTIYTPPTHAADAGDLARMLAAHGWHPHGEQVITLASDWSRVVRVSLTRTVLAALAA